MAVPLKTVQPADLKINMQNGGLRFEDFRQDTLVASVSREDLVQAVRHVRDELAGRFITSAGTDMRSVNGSFRISQLFALDAQRQFLVLYSDVDPQTPDVPTITGLIPGAAWAEREVRDMIGVTPTGHPDLRRLVLPDDWPADVHPLRRDFPFDERPPAAPENKVRINLPPKDASLFPIGPFFPTLEEPAFINLYVHGEQIVGMDYRGFYNHRGVEKLGDSELTYHQIPALAERICGICGFVHSSSYCQAVEKAAGITIPRRAAYIRTLLLELERIHSHLLWIGLACHFIGFDTLFMQAWRIREPIMWLTEYITGNRKTYGMNRIGGVSRDLPFDAMEQITPVIDKIEAQSAQAVDAILEDSSLRARLEGVGIISTEAARDYCVIGPTARGSGVDIDVRRDHPFAAYDELDFQVCVETGGDIWARTLVRIRELLESIQIVRQVLKKLPSGPIVADVNEITPYQVGVSGVEAPRGEVIHYILTGPDNRPYRWRVRAPTYNNLQVIPAMLAGANLADAPISVGSLDPCFSCTERIQVVDRDNGSVRIYRQAELLEKFQAKGRQ
jgi:Ni,Fe-hydrogenase III large subunit/Ni,Fe-hydrogenase III component G